MSDADLKAEWAKIDSPTDMLRALVEHSMFLGSDPYYRDLNDALLANADRVVKAVDRRRNEVSGTVVLRWEPSAGEWAQGGGAGGPAGTNGGGGGGGVSLARP